MSEGDDFLSRWSKRKRAVELDAEDEVASEVVLPDAPEDETEEAALERLGLPDPDALGEGDDVSGFLQRGVPEVLRRRALRRLWRVNPAYAHLDGLVEYGENYADPALVPEVVATAYKVGQGMLKKVLEVAEDEDASESADVAKTADDASETEVALLAEDCVIEDVGVAEDTPPKTASETEIRAEAAETQAVRPRRMRFSIS